MTGIFGYCDGVKGDDLYGWAWRPEAPNDPVEVEIWIDGRLTHETLATIYRPDLRAAGIGHGRYGWRVTLGLDPDRDRATTVLVRSRGGDTLVDGDFAIDVDVTASDRENATYRGFLDTVTGRGPAFVRATPPPPPPTVFLLYCPMTLDRGQMGAPEYSYAFVLRAFAPVLAGLGRTVTVASTDDANREVVACWERGEVAILLSFAPPQRTELGVFCQTIPVIAWEFPTIPTTAWHEEKRHDWRFVLRQCGRAITLSGFAADAIAATMGDDFPVAAIPSPVYDRFPELHAVPPPSAAGRIAIDGLVYDTRGRTYSPVTPTSPLPTPDAYPSETELDGTVFTSVFSPHDGRKNWLDIVSAFLTAHADEPGATLVFKMVTADPASWWWELHDTLNGMRPFACRLVVLHGFLDDDSYNALVRATHWVVNASVAEGQCLPLLEYMAAGRPAVAPDHTAMADYVHGGNAIIVASDEEDCAFPQDPSFQLQTTRHRVHWSSLAAAFGEAFRVTRDAPDRYAAMAETARATVRDYCGDAVVAAELDGFLGLNLGRGRTRPSPSALFGMLERP